MSSAPPPSPPTPWTLAFATEAERRAQSWQAYVPLVAPEGGTDEATLFMVTGGQWWIDAELHEDDCYVQRRMLLLLKPGQVLVLPSNPASGVSLFGRGDPQAEVVALPLKDAIARASATPLMKPLRESIMVAAMRMTHLEPRNATAPLGRALRIKPGETRRARPGQSVVAAGMPLWIASSDLAVSPPPLSDAANKPRWWLLHRGMRLIHESTQAGQIESVPDLKFFKRPDAAADVANLFSFQWREMAAAWRDRLHRSNRSETSGVSRQELQTQSTRGRLLGLLSGRNVHLPNTHNLPLRAAFFLIGQQGWLPVLPRIVDDHHPPELFKRIAASSQLITREVRLRGDWWQHDNGAFIAFTKDQKPRVLQRRAAGYRSWDPATDQTRPLTLALADELQPQVVMFFRQLPAQKITLFELATFEFQQVRTELVMLLALALGISGFTALLPVVSAFVVNAILPSALTSLLALVCGGLALLGLFQVGFRWIETLVMSRLNYRLNLAGNAALWHRVLHFPSQVLKRFSSGDLAVRMNALLDIQQFFRTLTQAGTSMSLQIASSIGVIIWVSFPLGLAVLGFGAAAILSAVGFAWWQIRAFLGGEKSLGLVNAFVLEIYSGVHKIKGAGAESAAVQQWADRYSRLRQKLLTTQRIGILNTAWQTSWVSLTTGLVYFLIAGLPAQQLDPAKFMAFLGAFAVLSMNLSGICGLILATGMQLPMLKFVEPLLNHLPDLRPDRMQPDHLIGNLRVEAASFAYAGQNQLALQRINLDLPAGIMLAITGESGAGKTTLGLLLSGLERPRSGHVFLDDYELDTLDPAVLRRSIAVVPQDYRLIPGSLFENIRGASDANREEVIAAAKLAAIWEDIDRMPMGLHTVAGSQFGTFSGGQIQRIAIARALIRKPRILVMDEATSALDQGLQARVIANLKSIHCTVIFIAHRLNVARLADQIIVVHQGQIAERGTDAELRAQNGHYVRLHPASPPTP